MSLKLYTAQYSYRGLDRVDTTVKFSDGLFAPTWDIVTGHKKGKVSDQEYTEVYYSLMRKSYMERHSDWLEFLSRDEATIVCFCPYHIEDGKPKFDHRHLLKDTLVACGAVYIGERGHIAI
jgi:hypothetical protein